MAEEILENPALLALKEQKARLEEEIKVLAAQIQVTEEMRNNALNGKASDVPIDISNEIIRNYSISIIQKKGALKLVDDKINESSKPKYTTICGYFNIIPNKEPDMVLFSSNICRPCNRSFKTSQALASHKKSCQKMSTCMFTKKELEKFDEQSHAKHEMWANRFTNDVQIVDDSESESEESTDDNADVLIKKFPESNRTNYTPAFKLQVLKYFERIQESGSCKNSNKHVAHKYGISHTLLSKWKMEKPKILELLKINGSISSKKRQRVRLTKSIGRYPLAETEVLSQIKDARKQGIRVDNTHIRAWMILAYKKHYPSNTKEFNCSHSWILKFRARHKLVRRRRTEKKNQSSKDREEIIKKFHRGLSIRSSFGKKAIKSFWGRWKPHMRLNMDQVPFNIDEGSSNTIDFEGTDTVSIKTRKGAADHRFGTLQITTVLSNNTPQPKIHIIFHGKGQKLAKERDSYHKNVIVSFNEKAWATEAFIEDEYMNLTLKPFIQMMPKGEKILFLDNHKCQTTKKFREDLRKENVLVHYLPPNCTDLLQPIDRGFGILVKTLMGQELQKVLLENQEMRLKFLELDGNRMTASECRIFMTHVIGNAYEAACKRYDFLRSGISTGCVIPAARAPKDLIPKVKIRGLDDYEWYPDDHKFQLLQREMDGNISNPDDSGEDSSNAASEFEEECFPTNFIPEKHTWDSLSESSGEFSIEVDESENNEEQVNNRNDGEVDNEELEDSESDVEIYDNNREDNEINREENEKIDQEEEESSDELASATIIRPGKRNIRQRQRFSVEDAAARQRELEMKRRESNIKKRRL